MCGIVGVAGDLRTPDDKIFEAMLLADESRGIHATGVALVSGACREVDTVKLAVPAYYFRDLPFVKKTMTGLLNKTVLLGHNRHATKGAAGDHANAHPFTHGHITMVHNGTLFSWHNLTPTNESYSIDSEAICRGIELEGIEVIAPKLRGAFALVWIDEKLKTLNFLRNSERRLGLLFNKTRGTIYWASELELAKWQLSRGSDLLNRSPVSWDDELELAEGKWISVPITTTGIDLSGVEIKDIDVSQSQTRSYPNTNYNSGYRHGYAAQSQKSTVAATTGSGAAADTALGDKYRLSPARETALEAETAKSLEDKGKNNPIVRGFIASCDADPQGAILDGRLGFWVHDYKPYSPNGNYGVVHGTLCESPYCTVVINGMSLSDFNTTFTKEEANGLYSGFLSGFSVEDPNNFELQAGYIVQGAENMVIMLRKDTLRIGDWDEYFPNEDPKDATRLALQATPSKETKEPQTVSSHVADASDTFKLSDDSSISVGGTVEYNGDSTHIPKNLRYHITRILYNSQGITSIYLKTSGTVSHKVSGENCIKGISLVDKVETFPVFDNTEVDETKWHQLTATGCSSCGSVPSDPKTQAETLEWTMDERFICGSCFFDIANGEYK